MFWFVFISIILFILFLIVILISSDISSVSPSRRLKEELKTKTGARKEAEAVPRTRETLADKQPLKPETAKVEDAVVMAAAEEIAVAVTAEPVFAEEQNVTSRALSEVEEHADTKERPSIAAEEPFILEQEPLSEEIGVFENEREEISDTPVEEEETARSIEEPEVPFDIEPLEEKAESLFETDVFASESIEQEAEAPMAEIAEAVEEEAAAEAGIEEVPLEVGTEEAYNYPPFDNTRAMEEFGLPKEDADEFIVDLIQQIEEEMPALEVAVQAQDNKQIENISHMIKGSATNLGTGGAADVLVDFNTYMKTGNDPLIIAGHMRNLHRSLAELKEQFQ